MQVINFYEEPVPHLIVDEFLEPRQAKKCLEEVITLEPHYKDAEILHHTHLKDDDDCEDCKKDRVYLTNTIRDNKILYLDEYYKDKRNESNLLRSLMDTTYETYFLPVINQLPYLFPIIENVNSTESILSSYGKCDFYGWHKDTLPDREQRIITLIYYLNIEPPKFTGGELVFAGKNISDNKLITPKHNRAVFFESKRAHRVNNVQLVGDFKYHRFSINMWFGFNGEYKL